MNHHIRSIDAGWENDDLVVLNPEEKEFRKVVSNGQEYLVSFCSLDDIGGYFSGETWVYWNRDKKGSISIMNIEDNEIQFLKVCEDGECTSIYKKDDYFFKDDYGYVIGINYPLYDRLINNNRIIVFYQSNKQSEFYVNEVSDKLDLGQRTVFPTTKTKGFPNKEHALYLNYLRKYDI